MSVIATMSVPAPELRLGQTLTATFDVRLRLERVVRADGSFVPYLWTAPSDVDHIEAALSHESDIESVEIVDSTDEQALLKLEWDDEFDEFFEVITDTGGEILDGVGEREAWWFQLRFDEHEHLTAFYRRCASSDISLDIETVHNPGTPREFGVEFELTDAQRETLHIALKHGHFDVPRESNLVELADQLGVSDTAVSERMRRGIRTLLELSFEDTDRIEHGD